MRLSIFDLENVMFLCLFHNLNKIIIEVSIDNGRCNSIGSLEDGKVKKKTKQKQLFYKTHMPG